MHSAGAGCLQSAVFVDTNGALVTRFILPPVPGSTAPITCAQEGTVVDTPNGLACTGACGTLAQADVVILASNDAAPAIQDVCFSRCKLLSA